MTKIHILKEQTDKSTPNKQTKIHQIYLSSGSFSSHPNIDEIDWLSILAITNLFIDRVYRHSLTPIHWHTIIRHSDPSFENAIRL